MVQFCLIEDMKLAITEEQELLLLRNSQRELTMCMSLILQSICEYVHDNQSKDSLVLAEVLYIISNGRLEL